MLRNSYEKSNDLQLRYAIKLELFLPTRFLRKYPVSQTLRDVTRITGTIHGQRPKLIEQTMALM